jgi:hypothetical protein
MTPRKRCIHDKQKYYCRQCNGGAFCRHEKLRSRCNICRGKELCIHSLQKYNCNLCGGKGICVHNKRKQYCVECNGSYICIHSKNKYSCRLCHDSRRNDILNSINGLPVKKYKLTKTCIHNQSGNCLKCIYALFLWRYAFQKNIQNYDTSICQMALCVHNIKIVDCHLCMSINNVSMLNQTSENQDSNVLEGTIINESLCVHNIEISKCHFCDNDMFVDNNLGLKSSETMLCSESSYESEDLGDTLFNASLCVHNIEIGKCHFCDNDMFVDNNLGLNPPSENYCISSDSPQNLINLFPIDDIGPSEFTLDDDYSLFYQ